jgi:hypothetical protein
MARYKLTKADRQKGRRMQALKGKVPAVCPDCSRDLKGYNWNKWLGHRGLHGLANRRFDGDIAAAQKHLQQNGLARQDPAAWNGAWRAYKPVKGDG